MPIYQYLNSAGGLVELLRTIAERDQVPAGLRRITVPARLAVLGTSSGPVDPHSAAGQVPRAYKQLEEKHGAGFLKESGFSVDEVRETWNF